MEISKPAPSFLRFGRHLVRLRHKDQTPTCLKCNRHGHQAKMCPDIFCFNCEELGYMTDSCPEEVQCCICRVTGHMEADCSFSFNRRSSRLLSDTSVTRLFNNLPSCLQILLNLLSNPPSLLMRHPPNSVLISQRKHPNRLLSLVYLIVK